MNSGNQVKYHTIWLCRIIQTHTHAEAKPRNPIDWLQRNFLFLFFKSECEIRGKPILSRKKNPDRHSAEQTLQSKPHCSSNSSSL